MAERSSMALAAARHSLWCLVALLFILLRPASGWAFVKDNGEIQIIAPMEVRPSRPGTQPAISFTAHGASSPTFVMGYDGARKLAIAMRSGGLKPVMVFRSDSGLHGDGSLRAAGVTVNTTMQMLEQVWIEGHLRAQSSVDIKSTLSVKDTVMFGSSLSVLDFPHVGSTLSLRSFCRLGSAMSVYGMSRLGSSLSLMDFAHIGSSLSLRSFVRLGSTCSIYGLTRLGASLSVLEFAHFGSSMSLRSYIRLGSSMSLYGLHRLGSSLSILDCVILGSSLSLRSYARLGSSVSVYGLARLGSSLSILDFGQLGSSLSLRTFARFGSTLSLYGLARLGSSLSVLDFIHLGASFSLRSFFRLGSSLSVYGMHRLGSSLSIMDFVNLGSGISLRSFCRIGSTLSIFGICKLGSSMSLLDFITIGSSLSMRSFVRLGSTLSVYGLTRLGSQLAMLDFANIGSSLAVRSFCRFGKELEATTLRFKDPNGQWSTTLASIGAISGSAPDGIQITVPVPAPTPPSSGTPPSPTPQVQTRLLSVTSSSGGGGTLHGIWMSDEVISSSEASLKDDIANLEDYAAGACTTPDCRADLRHRQQRDHMLHSLSDKQGTGASRPVRSFGQVLRELRPVAYRYKDSDPAHVRFGFVADELEALVPEVVRKVGEEGGRTKKGVVYQDLIALLTAALREHQGRLEAVERSSFSGGGFSERLQDRMEEAMRLLRQELKALTGTVATMQRQTQLQEMQQRLFQQELDRIKQQCDCAKLP